MLNKPDSRPEKRESVVIKKYANRRLYNTETSTYVTLDDLAEMVRSDRDFVVYDAKSGDDLTHSVLTQIIVDQESRGDQTLLPVPFLRQLIRFYGDSVSRMVPTYLQFSMETLAREQERFRDQMNQVTSAFGTPGMSFDAYQEQARRNMAIFESAMKMWSPFPNSGVPSEGDAEGGAAKPAEAPQRNELDELKSQLAAMQQKIEKLVEDKS